jgi:hypothetical protein
MPRRVTRGGGVRRLTQRYRVTRVMSRETGNMVVKVDVKENVKEGAVRQIRSPVRQIRLTGCPTRVQVT